MINANKGSVILGGDDDLISAEFICIIASLVQRGFNKNEIHFLVDSGIEYIKEQGESSSIEIDLDELKKQMKGDEENDS